MLDLPGLLGVIGLGQGFVAVALGLTNLSSGGAGAMAVFLLAAAAFLTVRVVRRRAAAMAVGASLLALGALLTVSRGGMPGAGGLVVAITGGLAALSAVAATRTRDRARSPTRGPVDTSES